MNDPTHLTHSELETQLMSPQGAALRDAHLARLHLLAARIHTHLSAGVSPAQYEKGHALAQSVDAATTILKQYPLIEAPAESVLTSAPIPPLSPREAT